MRRLLLALACALPLLFGGCDDPSGSSTSVEDTRFAPSLNVDLSAMTRTSSGLYFRDLAVGTGAPVAAGQRVSVHYRGWLANGTLFDENVAGETPFPFRVGNNEVIAGFDQGVVGMRVGGRRQLVIPSALGYGAQRNGPIPANSVLVFQIEVVSAQ